MKLGELRKFIRELIEEEDLEEMSTTGNVAGYQTPHAFSKSDKNDDEYIDRLNKSTGYTRVNEEYTNRWLELKNSDQTPNQKIGIGVRKIRRELAEMEKFVSWYSKIRKMNELGSDDYWKRTNSHLQKIKERLVGFAKKIQELESPSEDLTESNLNSLLPLSQQHKNTKIPNWNGIEGTFAAIVYSAIKNDTNITKPEKINMNWDRRAGVFELEYKGKKKRVKRKSINAELIVKIINSL